MTDVEWIEGVRGHLAELEAMGVRHRVPPGEVRVPYEPLSSYGIDLPALVVALSAIWLPEELPAGREWLAVDHGEQLVLTVLRPTPEAEEGMRRLRDRYTGSDLARPTIDQLAEYRDGLRELLGVDCEPGRATFREGCYPVRPSDLAALTDHPFDLPGSARVLVLDTLGAPQPNELADHGDDELAADEYWPCDYHEWIAAAFRQRGVRRGPGAEPFRALRYYGLKGPLLVLCVGYGYLASTRLPDRDWYAVRHRGDVLVLTVVEPTPEAAERLAKLAAEYPKKRFRRRDVSLDDLVAYRDRLRELAGVEVSDGLARLDEGKCPIDLGELPRLTADPLAGAVHGEGWEVFVLV